MLAKKVEEVENGQYELFKQVVKIDAITEEEITFNESIGFFTLTQLEVEEAQILSEKENMIQRFNERLSEVADKKNAILSKQV